MILRTPMKAESDPKQLNKKILPNIWLLFIIVHAFLSISFIFITNETLLNSNNILLPLMSIIGIYAGYKYQRRQLNPWGLLLGGVVLISTSITLQALVYFGVKSNLTLIIGIEEVGMVFVTLFAFTFMLLVEKEYNIQGFTTDYALIIFSITLFVLLLCPTLLNTFLYNISFIQQLNIINLFTNIVFLSMTIFNHILSKRLLSKDLIRIFMVLFLGAHFLIETLKGFELIQTNSISSQASWTFYHLAGSCAIAFIFLEKLSLDYDKRATTQMSSRFLWTANILAVIVTPLGIIIRDRLGYPPITIIAVGIAGFLLSSIVIWRIQKLVRDIEQQRKTLKTIAYVDSLTGLPNYHGYLDQLSSININNIYVVSINIEDFKSINDLYGRDFGDDVLKSLSKRIKILPENILVARTGADYFHAVFRTRVKDIQKKTDEIQLHLGVWDNINSCRVAVPLTYGASHSSSGFIKPEMLARQAEEALKISRQEHTNFTLYTEKTITLNKKKSVPRHELREILQKAVDDNYLPVHFQPIYDLRNGSLKALELLIRVESKEHGILLPGAFLDQAKSYGLLTPLTEVCVGMVAKSYDQLPKVTININLPPYMLNNAKILNGFIQCFKKANLPIEQFCIEVTEDGEIPTDQLVPSIKLLKSHGFKIAMDDFGTGYSSLSRLSVLPMDIVKIDRSLLLAASNGDKTILESAISLTKRLGATAVVEGVETLEQLALIKRLGADSVQGFLLSRPVQISKVPLLPLNATDIIAEF